MCLVDALASSLSLERDAIVVGRTKVFLRAAAEALIEGARDKALRKSALKELETAIEMENVDALEAAVAIATELRLDGSVLDRARSRVAVLRFRKHTASLQRNNEGYTTGHAPRRPERYLQECFGLSRRCG